MERVVEAKLLPPVLPRVVVPRPRLDAFLDEALVRRLTVVVAPAGFGKSTLLATWAEGHRCAWYTLTADDDEQVERLFHGVVAALRLRVPGIDRALREAVRPGQARGPDAGAEDDARARAHAGLLAMTLEDELTSDLVLVLDDLHEVMPGTAAARFVEALCRQAPPRLHLVVLSRSDPPFPTARLRAQGQAAELPGSTMAFDLDETAVLMHGVTGEGTAEAARYLHDATRGWPAAVRLGSEALRERSAVPASPSDVPISGTIYSILADEVFRLVAPEITELVRTVAPLDEFTAALCRALGLPHAAATLEALERRGLFLVPHGGGEGWYSLHPLVREFALEHLVDDHDEPRRTRIAAATWLEAAGHPWQALRCRVAAADQASIVTTLLDHGRVIVAAGGGDEVVRAIATIDAARHTPDVDQLEGEARHALGDWDHALECFARLGDEDHALPAAAAWRSGLIHYQRGDLDAALRCYEGGLGEAIVDSDHALLQAWAAAVYWLRGELDTSRKLALEAFEAARVVGDDRAFAAAHTALAMVAALEGDRRANDAHYLRAITHAERAGDVLQLIRIRINRASRFVEEGEYTEALHELDGAIRSADLAGYGSFRALALTNRGQALIGLGRLDEAARDLEGARGHYERIGSRFLAYPLANVGDVHRLRGDHALAKAAYEEAIALAEPTGDLQGLVPALTGLALVVVADEPERARRLADRAVAAGPALGHARAVLAQGWVALATGDRELAARRAREAATAGRDQRDRSAVAGAVELEACAGDEPAAVGRGLAEAASLWRALGDPLGVARTELAAAQRTVGEEAIALAESSAAGFRAAGARADAAAATALVAARRNAPRAPIEIHVLGGFRVLRRGVPIGTSEWGSRKPRDLLKVIVARRGGPVRRDTLLESLWPDEDPDRSVKKLSVALSTLRALLDPDKAHPADHFLAADRSSVSLVATQCDVDLERFLDAADAGLRAHHDGDPDAATALTAAESAYPGDPFEEDAYEEWAQSTRDVARATYISVIRALAQLTAAAADHDAAVRFFLRVLESDPYDERAHIGLVRSLRAERRHGEAIRMYRTYCDRMEQIGIEPTPFPAGPP